MAGERLGNSELMRRVADERAALEEAVAGFGADRLDAPGPSGWSAKDHLAHVSAWEKSLLALLSGGDRDAAAGLQGTEQQVDAMNEAIFQRNRSRPLDEVLNDFRDTHARVRERLEGMDDEALYLPYSHYQPDDPPYNAEPVVGWIAGNTYEHYAEHTGWLKDLLAQLG